MCSNAKAANILMEKKLNDPKPLQKILKSFPHRRYLLCLLFAFLSGCLLTGLFLNRPRPGAGG